MATYGQKALSRRILAATLAALTLAAAAPLAASAGTGDAPATQMVAGGGEGGGN